MGDWREQFVERPRDLSTCKRFRNQQDMVRLPFAKASVGFLRRIADNHDRKTGMSRIGIEVTPPPGEQMGGPSK